MSKSKPKAPTAPDPAYVASQQAQSNGDTARLNMRLNTMDQYTPYSQLRYFEYAPDKYRVDLTYTPEYQDLLNQQMGVDKSMNNLALQGANRLQDILGSSFNYNGMPAAPDMNSGAASREAVEQAMMSRLKPQMQRRREAELQRLYNSGITPGSEAYDRAQQNLNQGENDAWMQVLQQGGQEQNRIYNLMSDQRQRAINEALQQRSQPINEIAALLGTGQVQQPQTFNTPTTSVAPVNVSGLYAQQYEGQMNQYNQQMNARNNTAGGLFGLAGSGLSAYLLK
ncbi:MAG: hypothetical protein ACOYK8_00515 [Alphaproteobacteria bacterium]